MTPPPNMNNMVMSGSYEDILRIAMLVYNRPHIVRHLGICMQSMKQQEYGRRLLSGRAAGFS
eukprot:scaffold14673_cov74-Skeletonema_marinoi.AAC.2